MRDSARDLLERVPEALHFDVRDSVRLLRRHVWTGVERYQPTDEGSREITGGLSGVSGEMLSDEAAGHPPEE